MVTLNSVRTSTSLSNLASCSNCNERKKKEKKRREKPKAEKEGEKKNKLKGKKDSSEKKIARTRRKSLNFVQENVQPIFFFCVLFSFILFFEIRFCHIFQPHLLGYRLDSGSGSGYFFYVFLVACTRLYNPLCPSVCRSVGRSVGHTLLFSRLRLVLELLLLPNSLVGLFLHCPCPPARDLCHGMALFLSSFHTYLAG